MIVVDAAIWLLRVARLMPELVELWEAAKQPDQQAQLEASMRLVRAMSDQRMREELGSP